jgi:hypothetical protein
MQGKWLRKPTDGTAIVFVHGILSTGESCWQNENGTYWPALLRDEPKFPDIGIYVYTYETDIFSGTYSLNDVVDDLKERLLTLDKVIDSRRIVFVCHSMGGIVVRKLLVERMADFADRNINVGLYLVASPSLGSDYANWLKPLAIFMGHTQADALRFSQNNIWLNGLDKEFMNLKESDRLKIQGKELIEDKFIVLKGFWRKQVVEPFAGARYFGERYKVPASDHFSIAKPKDRTADQHRLLLAFIERMVSGVKVKPAPKPDRLPMYWHVPYNRNPHFTGREPELCHLETRLKQGGDNARAQAITGLSGIGKSQLALEYTFRHISDYAGVWWFTMETSNALFEDFKELAARLGLPGHNEQDSRMVIEAVRHRLGQERERWLLIYDNAPCSQELDPYLPQTGYHHILITSRDPNWLGIAEPFRLVPLSRTESVEFLLNRTNTSDNTSAEILAETLGDLPLALEQAGAYIEKTSIELADYIAVYRTRGNELRRQHSEAAIECPDSVATTCAYSGPT